MSERETNYVYRLECDTYAHKKILALWSPLKKKNYRFFAAVCCFLLSSSSFFFLLSFYLNVFVSRLQTSKWLIACNNTIHLLKNQINRSRISALLKVNSKLLISHLQWEKKKKKNGHLHTKHCLDTRNH